MLKEKVNITNSLLTLFAGLCLTLKVSGQNTASVSTAPVRPAGGMAPVETKAPNSDYKPAFAGQTRIAGVTTATPIEGKVLTEALKSPWSITALPDGRLLITEKEGTMRIVTTAGQVSFPITGLPKVNASGQGGAAGHPGRSSICHQPTGLLGVFRTQRRGQSDRGGERETVGR